jgi:hypothetical protein
VLVVLVFLYPAVLGVLCCVICVGALVVASLLFPLLLNFFIFNLS